MCQSCGQTGAQRSLSPRGLVSDGDAITITQMSDLEHINCLAVIVFQAPAPLTNRPITKPRQLAGAQGPLLAI